MAKHCSVCTHEQNEAINLEMLKGVPVRSIGKKYGISPSALQRHKDHIPRQLVVSKEAQEVAEASSVMQRLFELDSRVDEIFLQATSNEDPKLALRALKELREVTSIIAKLTGEMQEQTVKHIHITPEWLLIRETILRTLEPYPDARTALVEALARLGHD